MRGGSQGVVAEKNAPSPPHPLLSYKFYVHLKKYCKYVSLPYHFFATNRVKTKPIFTKQVFKTDFSFTGASETSSCLALVILSIKLPLPPSASLPIICNINNMIYEWKEHDKKNAPIAFLFSALLSVIKRLHNWVDHSQSLFYFVPQEKNITVKLARLSNPCTGHRSRNTELRFTWKAFHWRQSYGAFMSCTCLEHV